MHNCSKYWKIRKVWHLILQDKADNLNLIVLFLVLTLSEAINMNISFHLYLLLMSTNES